MLSYWEVLKQLLGFFRSPCHIAEWLFPCPVCLLLWTLYLLRISDTCALSVSPKREHKTNQMCSIQILLPVTKFSLRTWKTLLKMLSACSVQQVEWSWSNNQILCCPVPAPPEAEALPGVQVHVLGKARSRLVILTEVVGWSHKMAPFCRASR